MILTNAAGPGTYGPFTVRPGMNSILWKADGTASPVQLVYTDDAGQQKTIASLSVGVGAVAQTILQIPQGLLSLVVPTGVTSATVTLNPAE